MKLAARIKGKGSQAMGELEVLKIVRALVPEAGDDGAVLPFRGTHLVLTTDMLHRATDFPEGVTPRTIGWRSVAVSLSDLAAMGASPLGVLLAFGDPDLEPGFSREVLEGAIACCEAVGTRLVGGDLDRHAELTLTSAAIGEARSPVRRRGARAGDLVGVTGRLGRTQAALRLFARGDRGRANDLFSFLPRVAWGERLAWVATSMIDVSDGLVRSLYLLARESEVGCSIEAARLPVHEDLSELMKQAEALDAILFGGEDYELLFTVPERAIGGIDPTVEWTAIGRVTAAGVLLDGRELPDRGYEH